MRARQSFNNKSLDELINSLRWDKMMDMTRAGRKKCARVQRGITAENAVDYAATGVDVVYLESLTHSIHALDLKLGIMMTGDART